MHPTHVTPRVANADPAADSPALCERLPELLAELALNLVSQGQTTVARQCWEGLAAMQPEQPSTEVLGGLIAFGEGHFREAEQHYWRALDRAPGHTTARAFLAEALIAQRRFKEAEQVLDGLAKSRQPDPAAGLFGQALQQGFDSGLYQRVIRPQRGEEKVWEVL